MTAKYAVALHFGVIWAGISFVTIVSMGWLPFLCGWVLANLLGVVVWVIIERGRAYV